MLVPAEVVGDQLGAGVWAALAAAAAPVIKPRRIIPCIVIPLWTDLPYEAGRTREGMPQVSPGGLESSPLVPRVLSRRVSGIWRERLWDQAIHAAGPIGRFGSINS